MGYGQRTRKAQAMGDNNGQRPTFGRRLQELAATAGVPILGQPFVLEAWFLQMIVTCQCEQPKPVLIIGQPGSAAGQCRSCGKVYTLLAIGLNPNGQPQFNVAVTAGPAPAPASDSGT